MSLRYPIYWPKAGKAGTPSVVAPFANYAQAGNAGTCRHTQKLGTQLGRCGQHTNHKCLAYVAINWRMQTTRGAQTTLRSLTICTIVSQLTQMLHCWNSTTSSYNTCDAAHRPLCVHTICTIAPLHPINKHVAMLKRIQTLLQYKCDIRTPIGMMKSLHHMADRSSDVSVEHILISMQLHQSELLWIIIVLGRSHHKYIILTTSTS